MTDKSIHLIGNAHLDPIWLWRWQEGCGEVLQTFRSALDRLNEYPDFIFTCSSASYYKWVEEIDPEMFAEVAARIKEGRWVPVNGWWVQPDCNIPSGESFARQALYSQLYYYEKFGRICYSGYNVDSFGHNGMLPQLLKLGGMNYYVMMRPGMHENPNIPESLFWWDSPDGSRVLTYRIPLTYAASGQKSIDRNLEDLDQKVRETNHGTMLFYGVGNHGGGPTKGDIEYLQSILEVDGKIELEFSSPDDYFKEMLTSPLDIPVWKDDLQHHASGCYSATSLVKQLNRRAENALAAAEKINTLAAKIAGAQPETEGFAEAWRNVCFNQFHDILCGCSIMEAYEDVKESTGYAMTVAAKACNNASLKIARKIDTWIDGVSEPVREIRHHDGQRLKFPRPVVVFNPLSYSVELPVRTYHPSESVKDSEGNFVPFQNVRSSRSNDTHLDTLFLAKIPAMGYSTYWLSYFEEEPEIETSVSFSDEPLSIENAFIKAVFDKESGGILSLVDKTTGADLAEKGPLGIPTVISDSETDTWAHNVFTFHNIAGTMKLDSIELVEQGELRASVRAKYSYGSSTLTQEFCLAEGQRALRVKCKALWHEDFTLLKLPFDIGGSDEVSTYEIPCGFIKRPCNGEEEPSQQWADITSTDKNGCRRGLAIINDSKYSYDCPGTELRLTALRNVIFADHYSHRPPADFNFTDEGIQRFEYALYPHSGEAEKTDVVREAAAFNCRPFAVPESYHKGALPQKAGFIEVSAPNVVVTAIKFCEDGSGDLIVRCYETKGEEVKTSIMSEVFGFAFWSEFRGSEIKTFRIDKDGFATETNFLEGIVK